MNILTKNQQIIILRFIHAAGIVSSSEIQRSCNISRKTLTAEVQVINEYLCAFGAYIETVKGTGYLLKVSDEQKYREFCTRFSHDNQRNRYLYIERNYLAYFILFELVLNDGYISIEDLCDKFHYSRGTVSNSIKVVKSILGKYKCTLDSRPNYGLKFISTEWNKRICLIFFDKIAFRMSTIIPEAGNVFAHVLDKKKYNHSDLELIIGNIFRNNNVKISLQYFVKIILYAILTQTRIAYYDLIDFSPVNMKRIKNSMYLKVSEEIAQELRKKGFIIGEKDVCAFTILLESYVTREHRSEVEEAVYIQCKEEAEELIACFHDFYPGVEINLDAIFVEEFVLHLAGLKQRLWFDVPSDDESSFAAKNDGIFITDLCRDFAAFYYQKYRVKLSEAEALSAYYIFSSSFLRNINKSAYHRVALVSRLGIHFAQNVAERIFQQYRNLIAEVHTFEFVSIDTIPLEQYHVLMTDIEQKRYNFISIPIIKLDFFRQPKDSRAITEYFTLIASRELHEIIKEPYLVKDREFSNKNDVFRYLASHYVPRKLQEKFIEDCLSNDAYISFERCNRIVFIPTSSDYYEKKQIIMLFNKTPFLWDNELVQTFILFSRRNQKYKEIKTLNATLAVFLHLDANVTQALPLMKAEAVIDYISYKIYN